MNPYKSGSICTISGTKKKVRIIKKIEFSYLERDGSVVKPTEHIYEVEHITGREIGDKNNYPHHELTAENSADEAHLNGIIQGLNWVISVLNGEKDTWLITKQKCDEIKELINKLRGSV